jgi:hypothetical protein
MRMAEPMSVTNALRFADDMYAESYYRGDHVCLALAAEVRRLQAENAALLEVRAACSDFIASKIDMPDAMVRITQAVKEPQNA